MKVLSKKDRIYLNRTVNSSWKISVCGYWAYPTKENIHGYKPDYFIEHIHFNGKMEDDIPEFIGPSIDLGVTPIHYHWKGFKIINDKCGECGEEVPAHVKTEYMMEHV